MRIFDYGRLKSTVWDSEMLGLVAQIHEYKGRQELYLKQKPAELDRLIEIAKIQSTEASNEIEGIENQFAIINGYITKQSDFQNAEILYFSDNGCSGINMEREQFQELLTKVRQREIDVVIVKDFSRLGRNYLDVCKLKDSIFPFMKIRLIAVSENYDSEHQKTDMSDFSATFRSVLNEYYVLESSEKIFKSCEQQIRDGKFIGRIPYGFFLSDRSTVCIQEEQVLYAEVLKKVREYLKKELDAYQCLLSAPSVSKEEELISELKGKKAELFEQLFQGNITEQEFESQNQEITCEIGKCQKAIESYRKLSAMNIRYHDERPVDTLRRIYEAPELTREHMQFVKRIDICNTETFVIQLEEDTPLAVLCRNMDIYETD